MPKNAPGYLFLAALVGALWVIFGDADKQKAADEAAEESRVAACVRERLNLEYRSAEWYEIPEGGRINYRRVCLGKEPIRWN
jgi:hypothetical protein